MAEFSFSLYSKVTTWMTTPFSIEAETLEEARKKAILFHVQGDTAGIDWEDTITDTSMNETMSVEDNGGEPTEELVCNKDWSIIWSNADKD